MHMHECKPQNTEAKKKKNEQNIAQYLISGSYIYLFSKGSMEWGVPVFIWWGNLEFW